MTIKSGKSIYGNYYCEDSETGIIGYGSTSEDARLELQNKLADYRNKQK